MYNYQQVGTVNLDETVVAKMEEQMKEKFKTLDCQPFVISATFKSNTEDVSMKLLSIDILEEKK
jgi:hypothetical protein